MSDLFTQQSTMPELFKTGEDIAEELKAQTVEPNTATDLLLNGDSKPNRFSRQCAENEEPDADLTENLLHDEKSNKNTITGTNTPRSSRASAYYDLLRSQHKNGHYKAPAYRVVDTIESPLQAGASALNYHDDFDTDAVTESFYRRFGRTVDRGSGVSVESRRGTEVYDMPRVPLKHGGKEGTGHKEKSFDVCVDGLDDIIDLSLIHI